MQIQAFATGPECLAVLNSRATIASPEEIAAPCGTRRPIGRDAPKCARGPAPARNGRTSLPFINHLAGTRAALTRSNQRREIMRYVLLWLLGIPIPVLILLAVFKVI
jgi:hypothetical protein